MFRADRNLAALTALAGLALLGGCNRNKDVPPPPEAIASRALPLASASGGPADVEGVTPVKDRVATLGLLNKRNNITQTFTLKPGESRRYGNVVVRLASCEHTAPWEDPQETGAFVQLYVEERATVREKLAWHKVFSGWLFKNSPSLNVVEHPVYDVWVKDCAMHFPGEANPGDAASNKAAKASGSGKKPSAPKPAAKPEPAPAAVGAGADTATR
jgi:hypothetical protein